MARLGLLGFLVMIGCAGSIRWQDHPLMTNREMVEKLMISRITTVLDSIPIDRSELMIKSLSIHPHGYLVDHHIRQYFLDRKSVTLRMDSSAIPCGRIEYRIELLGISLEKLNRAYLFQTRYFSRRADLIINCHLVDSSNRLQSSFQIQGSLSDTLPADLALSLESTPPLIIKQPPQEQSNPLIEGIVTVMIMITVLYLFYVDKEG
ncbi:MAG: hypothetical protein KBA26_03940 [Candidatus Delongbacteria bacterium]|nr:hypothetical protein [Candidatus Delongbacteria bacterium]